MKLWKTIKERQRQEREYWRSLKWYEKAVEFIGWFLAYAAGAVALAGPLALLYIAVSEFGIELQVGGMDVWLGFSALIFPLYVVMSNQQLRRKVFRLEQENNRLHRAALKKLSKQMADSLGVDDAAP